MKKSEDGQKPTVFSSTPSFSCIVVLCDLSSQQLLNKASHLWLSLLISCYCPHPPMWFIIITQPTACTT